VTQEKLYQIRLAMSYPIRRAQLTTFGALAGVILLKQALRLRRHTTAGQPHGNILPVLVLGPAQQALRI
jgi:hypothetical protein